MDQAKLADEVFQQSGKILSPVFGLPIAIKDNIFTKEMPTSVGTYLLREFIPKEDAPLVKALKEAGALIIGKANLSELANFMGSKMPSGYSSSGGQTLNPYNKEELTPLGSSSGSGVIATLNLAAATIGTETTGSITAPAAVTSTVGFKPSLHAAMDQAIFPLASTMDCPGPITRTVSDAIVIFDIIRQTERQDTTPQFQRIGISTRQHPMREKLLVDLKLNDISPEDVTLDIEGKSNLLIIIADFALDVASFTDNYCLPFKALSELVSYNEQDLQRRALYGQDLVESATKNSEATKEAGQKQVEEVEKYLDSLDIDLLITFNNWDILLPATAGYPELTIPYGQDEDGAPQGITLISKKGTDDQLLAFWEKIGSFNRESDRYSRLSGFKDLTKLI